MAAKVDLLGVLRAGDKPGGAQLQPVVRQLHLLAVHDLLLENAQLIADGVARSRDLQGGGGLQIAGRQTAQAAVAQTRVGLQLEEVGGGEAQRAQGLLQLGQDPKVEGVLLQGTAHQELQGEVVDLAGVVLLVLLPRLHPVARHNIPQDQGAGLEHIGIGGLAHVPAKGAAEFIHHQFGQLFGGITHKCDSCLSCDVV